MSSANEMTAQDTPTVELASTHLTARLTTTGGLRIAGLARAGVDENVLGCFPDVRWDSPWRPYPFVGGHRLWLAPERQPDVCEPEPDPVSEQEHSRRACLTHRTPSPSGLLKMMVVELHDGEPALTVRHRVENHANRSQEFALWAMTMLELGGIALVPHDATPLNGAIYTPNRLLVGWPYTSFTDERLTLRPDLLAWEATRGTPWKIGTFSRPGQVAYARDGVILDKRFEPIVDASHADGGCNVEIYSNDRFAEIETLSPLTAVAPGASVEHVEHWRLHTLSDGDAASIEELVARLSEQRETT